MNRAVCSLKLNRPIDSLGRLSKEEVQNSSNSAFIGSTEYSYDIRNNLTNLITNYGGLAHEQKYYYSDVSQNSSSDEYEKDNLPTMYKLYSSRYAVYDYDSLNRLTQRKFTLNTPLYYNYVYKKSDNRNTSGSEKYQTTQIKEEYIGNDVYIYGYDVLGNITSIKTATRSGAATATTHTTAQNYVTYSYDDLGQLKRENLAGKKTSVWDYDNLGNITAKNEYAYTTGTVGTATKTVSYYYKEDDIPYEEEPETTKTYSSWNNLLLAVDLDGSKKITDDETIEYDEIGNPTQYLGAELKWNGRQLTSYKTNDKEISYTYDSNGLRASKTVNGVVSKYFYVNGQLHYEEKSDGTKLYFFYDSNGYLTGVKYNGTNYYAATNRRGDVVAIYNKDLVCLAKYEYDAWGNVISIKDANDVEITSQNSIGIINPIRYRGYYYDAETKLYYLQSRYYNTEVGRFLNSDSISDSGAGVLGYNTFIYCANNPVIKYDPTGHFGLVSAIIATGAIVGGLLGGLSAASTGGNVVEGVVEGALTGALGAACGILISNPIVAVGLSTLGGATIDFATQVVTQSVKSKSMDFSNVDYGRVVKTGIQTGLGTAVPALGDGAGNAVDAFGTALIWAEASTVITCADIIITNTIESFSKDVTTRQENGEDKKSETIILIQE